MDLKKMGIVAAGLFMLLGCGQHENFTIKGKITGANKDTLVLKEATESALETRSTIITGSNGSFSITDTAGSPRLLVIQANKSEHIMLMVLNGEQVSVEAEKGKISETLKISGSPQSQLIMELNKEIAKATNKLDSLGKQYQEMKGHRTDAEADAWAQGEFKKVFEQQRSYIRAFIEKHVAEPASLIALSHQIGRQSVLNASTDFDLFEKVDVQMYRKYPESPIAVKLHKYVEAMQQQRESAESQAKVSGTGTIAPDIALPDPSGKTQKLSSLRGKIVLLDFWAAWCGPCRRENPNLVAAYKKYHDKGFEIYQVSLDKTKSAWEAAIKQDGLNWIHVSDLKYWNSAPARLYGVQSVPANFLLDSEGKIIATNLRGTALEEELAKLFH